MGLGLLVRDVAREVMERAVGEVVEAEAGEEEATNAAPRKDSIQSHFSQSPAHQPRSHLKDRKSVV